MGFLFEFEKVLLEDSVFLLEQLEVLEKFGDILVVSPADGVDEFDDLLVLLGDGLLENFVLGD